MAINIKKSCCLWIGPRADAVCSDITCLSGLSLNWVNEIRYLGISVVKSRYFKCSLDYMLNVRLLCSKCNFWREKWQNWSRKGHCSCYVLMCACFVIWSRSLSFEHFGLQISGFCHRKVLYEAI